MSNHNNHAYHGLDSSSDFTNQLTLINNILSYREFITQAWSGKPGKIDEAIKAALLQLARIPLAQDTNDISKELRCLTDLASKLGCFHSNLEQKKRCDVGELHQMIEGRFEAVYKRREE
ncbi:MAG: hypothetical protein Q9170_005293 [Blastenia crenularia]